METTNAENQEAQPDRTVQDQKSSKLQEEDNNTDSVTSRNTEHDEPKQNEQQNNLEQPPAIQTQPESTEKPKDKISILLMGRSGHGKSSIGNSILGKKGFEPKSNLTEENQCEGVAEATGEVSGREVQVVDATGLVDNDEEFPENADHFIDLANKAMDVVPQTGYSAIVLVLKYGIRFTKQEAVAVKMIKSLFGPEVIQRHGIIVMTCGDQFKRDMEDEGLDFHQWCGQQEGEVKRLMEECDKRCVLFDNKTKDPKRQQVQQLMNEVDKVKGQTAPYNEINFRDAEPRRVKLQVMAKLPHLELKMDSDLQEFEKDLDGWLSKLEELEKYLIQEDKGTGSVAVFITKLRCIKQHVGWLKSSLKTSSSRWSQRDCPDTASASSKSTAADSQVTARPRSGSGLLSRAANFIRGKMNGH